MERETDQYMNADEYVQELLINVRSLAGEYLNWKNNLCLPGREESGIWKCPGKAFWSFHRSFEEENIVLRRCTAKQNSQSGDGRSSLWNICFISKKPENI